MQSSSASSCQLLSVLSLSEALLKYRCAPPEVVDSLAASDRYGLRMGHLQALYEGIEDRVLHHLVGEHVGDKFRVPLSDEEATRARLQCCKVRLCKTACSAPECVVALGRMLLTLQDTSSPDTQLLDYFTGELAVEYFPSAVSEAMVTETMKTGVFEGFTCSQAFHVFAEMNKLRLSWSKTRDK